MAAHKVDWTGRKYGRLTVRRRARNYRSPKGQVHPRWHCDCKCGGHVTVRGGSLASDHTRSCGCLRREVSAAMGRASFLDLTGRQFGWLKVLDFVGMRFSNARWLCRCRCGNEVTVASGHLTKRPPYGTTSCGCRARIKASRLMKRLHKDGRIPYRQLFGKANPNFRHGRRCRSQAVSK